MVLDVTVNGADEHGSGPDIAVRELEMALRVRLGVGDGLHAALQLNQNDVNAGAGLAGGAVVDCAGEGSCRDRRDKEAEKQGGREKANGKTI